MNSAVFNPNNFSSENEQEIPENGFQDMVQMQVLCESQILNNLKIRYTKSLIFTYIGPSLLIINPYKDLPASYSQAKLLEILENKDIEQPNIYSVALNSVISLENNQKNQAIVISGESGAGKTETTKHCMRFITFQSIEEFDKNEKNKAISQKILDCNPIMEAFGNAKTVRNDNSSRFGKYVRLIIGKKKALGAVCGVQGATITSYLLEKSRVIDQSINERNFHIFYFMLAGLSQKQKIRYFLDKYTPETLNYLKNSQCYKVQNIDDFKEYKVVENSFLELGFNDYEIEGIFQILSGILLLGNLEFSNENLTDNTACHIKTREISEKISNLFEINSEELEKALVWKIREVNKQQILSPLSLKECEGLKDSLSKNLYEKLFLWLVKKLNLTVFPEDIQKKNLLEVRKSIKILRKSVYSPDNLRNSIGLLDIFGFENFEINSFEQLCINFTNEKLQQLYISYIYKAEENELKSQGFDNFPIEFHDNQGILDLIEKYPISILDLLDESTSLNSSSDENYLQSLQKSLNNNPNFKVFSQNTSFQITHTAKPVLYQIKGFRNKNRDEITKEIDDILCNSKNIVIKEAFISKNYNEFQCKTGKKFLASKFKGQIKDLMGELGSCEVSFVRCLKPNEVKKPEYFDDEFVLLQIKYLGLLDSIKIRKKGYEIRRNYQDFYQKYREILQENKGVLNNTQEIRNITVIFFEKHRNDLITTKEILFGKTKIFMKCKVLRFLEDALIGIFRKKSENAQKILKQYNIYKFKKRLKLGLKGLRFVFKAIIKLQSKRKCILARKKFLQKKNSVAKIDRILLKRSMREGFMKFISKGISMEKHRKKTKALIKFLEIYKKRGFKTSFFKFIKILRSLSTISLKINGRFSIIKPKETSSNQHQTRIDDLDSSNNVRFSIMKAKKTSFNKGQTGFDDLESNSISQEKHGRRVTFHKEISFTKSSTINLDNDTINLNDNRLNIDKSSVFNNETAEIIKLNIEKTSVFDRNTNLENINLSMIMQKPNLDTLMTSKNLCENINTKEILFNDDKSFVYHFETLFTKKESLLLGSFADIPKSLDCYLDLDSIDQEFLQTIKSNDFIEKAGVLLKKQRKWLKIVSKDKLLSYQRSPLSTSLQNLKENHEVISEKIFKFILQYCYDIPCHSNLMLQVEKLLSIVIAKPLEPELVDETYLLMIKQLRNNPSPQNSLRIYRLLGLVSSVRPPSLRLYFPVMNFLYNKINEENREELEAIKYIISKLRDGFEKGSRKVVPSENEIILIEYRKIIQLPINFMNGGCLILHVEPHTTVKELISLILMKLNKEKLYEYFGIYEICWKNNIIISENYLENDGFILDRVNRMEKYRKIEPLGNPKPKLKFFFRIRIFYKFNDQDLDSLDLLYHQFFMDIVNGKYFIENTILSDLIGVCLSIDFGQFDMEKSAKMPLNLERYLPSTNLLSLGAKCWFEKVMKSYSEVIFGSVNELKMRFLKILKENDMFFSHNFQAKYSNITVNEENEGIKSKKEVIWVIIKPLILEILKENQQRIRYEFNKITKWGNFEEKSLIIYTNDNEIHMIYSPEIKEIEFLIKSYVRIAIQLSVP